MLFDTFHPLTDYCIFLISFFLIVLGFVLKIERQCGGVMVRNSFFKIFLKVSIPYSFLYSRVYKTAVQLNFLRLTQNNQKKVNASNSSYPYLIRNRSRFNDNPKREFQREVTQEFSIF